jgi:DNA-binding transcriptional regulator LsrR (DeoR family)
MHDMAMIPMPLIRTKSRAQQQMEHQIGESLEVALFRRYVIEGMTQEQIAAEWGIDRATVSRWMRDCGIRTRIIGPRLDPAA